MIPLDTPEALTYFCLSELARASQEHSHPWRLGTLAVCGSDAIPRALKIVVRDFGAGELVFFTDKRTLKVKNFYENPQASFCFYNPALALQLQVNGSVELHEQDELCQHYWDRLPAHNKICYASPEEPGTFLPTPLQFNKPIPEKETFENFMTIKCYIKNFDILYLRKKGNLRVTGKFDGEALDVSWVSP